MQSPGKFKLEKECKIVLMKKIEEIERIRASNGQNRSHSLRGHYPGQPEWRERAQDHQRRDRQVVNVLSAAERTVVINDVPNLRPKLAGGKNGIPDLNLGYRLDDLCDKETEDKADDVLQDITDVIDTTEYNAVYAVEHMMVIIVVNVLEQESASNGLGAV